jgi:hypothetical protein
VRAAMPLPDGGLSRMTTMLEIVTLGFGLFSSCLFLAHAYDSYQDVAANPRSQ